MLHSRDSSLSPIQSSPLFAGGGLVQLRVWICLPPPHVTVHSLQGPQLDQFPSTAKAEQDISVIFFISQWWHHIIAFNDWADLSGLWYNCSSIKRKMYHDEKEFTWTRVFIAHSCFITLPRAWLSSELSGGIGTGSRSILYSATACDWAITPVLPVGPIAINWIEKKSIFCIICHWFSLKKGKNGPIITWTRVFIASSRFFALSRTRLSSKLRWWIATSSWSFLHSTTTSDRTITPFFPIRPVTIN